MIETVKDKEYEMMRGEYLSLMAYVEYSLTYLISEYLDVRFRSVEFRKWLVQVPIPFGWKVSLFEELIKDNTIVETNFEELYSLKDFQDFRNTLAHSFGQHGHRMTVRGKRIPSEHVSPEALRSKLEELRSVESAIDAMIEAEIVGVVPPISADDYADWPL